MVLKNFNLIDYFKKKISFLIEEHWKNPKPFLYILLKPISLLFYLIISIRLFLYKKKIFNEYKTSVPIVIVGNIHVGGVGKTPVVIELANRLKDKNIRVGIISRGYGRKNNDTILVNPDGNYEDFGDEPLLIAQKTKLPVCVGGNRKAAVDFLLNQFQDIQVIISDDGLQHYQLNHHYEIAIFPFKDLKKKLSLFPNGNLREPLSRLKDMDAIIFNQYDDDFTFKMSTQMIQNKLNLEKSKLFFINTFSHSLYSLKNPEMKIQAPNLNNFENNIALCAIGSPKRFFTSLKRLNIQINQEIFFEDHHTYSIFDIPKNYHNIITTEKDAVKLQQFNLKNVWVLPIDITLKPDIIDDILSKIVVKKKEVSV